MRSVWARKRSTVRAVGERLELGRQLRRGADAARPVVDVPGVDVDAEGAPRRRPRGVGHGSSRSRRLAGDVEGPLGRQRQRDQQRGRDATGEQIQRELLSWRSSIDSAIGAR